MITDFDTKVMYLFQKKKHQEKIRRVIQANDKKPIDFLKNKLFRTFQQEGSFPYKNYYICWRNKTNAR